MSCPFLKELWQRSAGLFPAPEPSRMPEYEALRKSEWSERFECLMRNRLVMGAFRYGLLHDPAKKRFDRVTSIVNRVELYRRTGNLEHLVDVANTALLEFEEGDHPLKHFHAVDDGEHTMISGN